MAGDELGPADAAFGTDLDRHANFAADPQLLHFGRQPDRLAVHNQAFRFVRAEQQQLALGSGARSGKHGGQQREAHARFPACFGRRRRVYGSLRWRRAL